MPFFKRRLMSPELALSTQFYLYRDPSINHSFFWPYEPLFMDKEAAHRPLLLMQWMNWYSRLECKNSPDLLRFQNHVIEVRKNVDTNEKCLETLSTWGLYSALYRILFILDHFLDSMAYKKTPSPAPPSRHATSREPLETEGVKNMDHLNISFFRLCHIIFQTHVHECHSRYHPIHSPWDINEETFLRWTKKIFFRAIEPQSNDYVRTAIAFLYMLLPYMCEAFLLTTLSVAREVSYPYADSVVFLVNEDYDCTRFLSCSTIRTVYQFWEQLPHALRRSKLGIFFTNIFHRHRREPSLCDFTWKMFWKNEARMLETW